MNLSTLHDANAVLATLKARGFFSDGSDLKSDSRQLTGVCDVFVAIAGRQYDPRQHAQQLLQDKRCGLVLVDGDDPNDYPIHEAIIPVLNLRHILPDLAARYYQTQQTTLTMIAVTGTNGKTSVTRYLAQGLQHLGVRAAVMGTLGYGAPDALQNQGGLTTPDVLTVHRALAQLQREGFQAVCLEASSIGLQEGRLNGVPIHLALMSNFSQDHLDYHGTMEAYAKAKLMLANWPGLLAAAACVHDGVSNAFLDAVRVRGLPTLAVHNTATHHASVAKPDDVALNEVKALNSGTSADVLQVTDVDSTPDGMCITLNGQIDSFGTQTFYTQTFGTFNANNLALVAAALLQLRLLQRLPKLSSNAIDCSVLSQCTAAPGRMQVAGDAPLVMVDYAHTPDALLQVLSALRPTATARKGRLWVVFGCGGNRDAIKRPKMGQVAAAHADVVVLTSDNPRDENPTSIMADVYAGIASTGVGGKLGCSPEIHQFEDRRLAIEFAIGHAHPNDVVLLAGKGHETTQEVAGQHLPFVDVEVAEAVLRMHSPMMWPYAEWAKAMLEAGAQCWLDGAPCSAEQAIELNAQGNIRNIQTDSRLVGPGDVFICLKGERFDAHDFAAEVVTKAPLALVVERFLSNLPTANAVRQWVVPDARVAYAAMARAWRLRFNVPVVAVVGSNGKTTTKEMLAQVFRSMHAKHHVLVTHGNLNNDVGVPASVLRLRAHHRIAVLELGMNHPGEIAQLADVVLPQVVLMTNAQREHQEFMKSIEAVAIENGQAFLALGKWDVTGCIAGRAVGQAMSHAVFPAGTPFDALWERMASNNRTAGHDVRIVRFGLAQALVGTTDVTATFTNGDCVLHTPLGRITIQPQFLGEHNASNAAGVAAAAIACGADSNAVALGLARFQPVSGRLRVVQRTSQFVLIDDTYNANPDSVNAASQVLAGFSGYKVLVLGDMGEVGGNSDTMHHEVGAFAARCGVDALLTLGEATRHAVAGFGAQAVHCTSHDAVVLHLRTLLDNRLNECGHDDNAWPCVVLVKGSRFMKMERVVQGIMTQLPTQLLATGAQHAA